MKVFISWSGSRSKQIASSLRDWLPQVNNYIEPWMSAMDIEPGVRWSKEIAENLELIKFGIFCLTPGNTNAPWLLFEAGAISKTLENSRVLPYLFELKATDVRDPLAQFQSIVADKEGTKNLVTTIFNALDKDISLSKDIVDNSFETFWPRLENSLKAIDDNEIELEEIPDRDNKDLLEETVERLRKIEGTISILASNLRRDSSIVIPASIPGQWYRGPTLATGDTFTVPSGTRVLYSNKPEMITSNHNFGNIAIKNEDDDEENESDNQTP